MSIKKVKMKKFNECDSGTFTSLLLFAPVLLTGCVAVWGEAHKVVSADSNGIKIQYDTALTSSARTAMLARVHCKKFGKTSEPVEAEMPGLLIGIMEESYECIENASSKTQ